MGSTSFFERLVASATLIARHVYYPGKEQVVDQCLEDAEELMLAGRITAAQREILRDVLLGSLSHAT